MRLALVIRQLFTHLFAQLVASPRRRKLLLVLLLVALALLSPWLWLWQAPTTLSALLWRDYATIASWLLLTLLVVMTWRLSPRLVRKAGEPSQHNSGLRMRPDGHRWLGVVMAVPLSWLLLSGSLTLYRAELDLWLTPSLRGCCELAEPSSVSSAAQIHTAQQFLVQQHGAADATRWYIELASARKPYLTLHWPAVSEPGFALYRQYVTLQGEPLGATMLVHAGQQSQTFGGLVFDWHYTLLGRAWLEPIKRSLADVLPPTVLGWLPSGLGLCATFALAWCVFSLSGLGLSWRLLRQSPSQVLPRPGRWRQQGALRWHIWLGLLVSPWLLLYGVSAVVMQLGNWRDVPTTLSTGEYYAALFPQPTAPQPPALETSVATMPAAATIPTKLNTLLPESQLQRLVAQWPHWPVGKITWQRPTATSAGFWQLSPRGDAQWPQTPSGAVNPTSMALQHIEDASLSVNDAAAVSSPWQLRHHLYQLHQSAYLNPWGRAIFCGLGLLAWLCLVLAVRRWQQTRPSWQRRVVVRLMVELPWAGLVLAALWFNL